MSQEHSANDRKEGYSYHNPAWAIPVDGVCQSLPQSLAITVTLNVLGRGRGRSSAGAVICAIDLWTNISCLWLDQRLSWGSIPSEKANRRIHVEPLVVSLGQAREVAVRRKLVCRIGRRWVAS
jgi:hypothetical protein